MPADRSAPPHQPVATVFDRRDETPRLWENPGGVYRRRIIVRRVDAQHVAGELEDDYHHFRVDIRHDGATVTEVTGAGMRGPWATCHDAHEPLAEIIGLSLSSHPTVLAGVDARRNCTHLFDLTGLALTHAARGGAPGDRRYDIAVTEPTGDDQFLEATLWCDGVERLHWELRSGEIAAPEAWVGAPLRTKFIPWACERFAGDDDSAEAAIVLRRAIDISRGRQMDLDTFDSAEPLLSMMEGICYSMTAARVPVAIRQKGSARDFTDRPGLLLADFDTRRA